MNSAAVVSIVRTAAGYLAAYVVSLPAAPAIERAAGVSAGEAKTAITGGLVLAGGTLYYAAVRRIERRWPAAGRLLGVARPPSYADAPARSGEGAEAIAAQIGAELVDVEPPAHSAL